MHGSSVSLEQRHPQVPILVTIFEYPPARVEESLAPQDDAAAWDAVRVANHPRVPTETAAVAVDAPKEHEVPESNCSPGVIVEGRDQIDKSPGF